MSAAEIEGAQSRRGEPSAAPALELSNVSKTFNGNTALSYVSLSVISGEVHVLLGQNGSGKSTLIKVLSGYHEPDSGSTVRIGGAKLPFGKPDQSYRLGCRFVHQDLGLISTSSVLDNLCLGAGYPTMFGTVRGRAALSEARTTLRRVGLEIDPAVRLSTLTASQRTELAVARALRPDQSHTPKVLVLDEPTATLPIDEVDHLLDTVRAVAASGVAVLLVTHNLDEVLRVADQVSVLRDGRLVLTAPIAELNQRTMVRALVGKDVEDIQRNEAVDSPAGTPLLSVADLQAQGLLGVSFQVRAGEIVGLAGLTGSGRETVLAAVFGAVRRYDGNVTVRGSILADGRPDLSLAAGLAYLPGDRRTLSGIMQLSARENLTLPYLRPFWKRARLRKKQEARESLDMFARLGVQPSSAIEAPLATFSGGNQQKILFGKWLRRKPSVFLLDDPTQGVDVGAKAELHRQLLALARDGTAVLISSTDIEELAALCDRVLIFWNGRVEEEVKAADLSVAGITHRILGYDSQERGSEK